MPLVCGGLSGDVKAADEAIHEIFAKLKEEVRSKVSEKRQGLSSTEWLLVPVAYKTQIVAGTNFFVKVKVAEEDFIHARIYRDLQGNVTLHSVTDTKTEEDEIVHF